LCVFSPVFLPLSPLMILSNSCLADTTAWCIRTNSSTTFSMVGALNKLPVAASGVRPLSFFTLSTYGADHKSKSNS
jgi:hypothetical protein